MTYSRICSMMQCSHDYQFYYLSKERKSVSRAGLAVPLDEIKFILNRNEKEEKTHNKVIKAIGIRNKD